jgi:hypothetical protein
MQRTRGPRKRPPVQGSAILLVEEARTRSLFRLSETAVLHGTRRAAQVWPSTALRKGTDRVAAQHVPFGHRRRLLGEPVGECGLAVVDTGDVAEVPDALDGVAATGAR